MSKRTSARDLVRLALHYAIEERQGWLASVGNPAHENDAPHVARAEALVSGWRDLLARRYGERPMSERVVAGRSVPLMEVVAAPPREFQAPEMRPLKLSPPSNNPKGEG